MINPQKINKHQISFLLSILLLVFSSSCQTTGPRNELVSSDKTPSVSNTFLAPDQAIQVALETNTLKPPTRTPTPFPIDLKGKLSIQTDTQLYLFDFDTYKLEEIQIRGIRLFSALIFSNDGSKIVYAPSYENHKNLYIYNRETGENTLIVSYEGQEAYLDGWNPPYSWSPDDKKIAFVSSQDGNSEINVVTLEDNNITNISNNEAADETPDWSPYGEKIAFLSDRSGSLHIYIMNSDGSQPRRITPLGFPEVEDSKWALYVREPTWSPDGKKLAFIAANKNDELDLFVIDSDGNNLTQLTQSNDEFSFSFENRVVWSPDSTKIAFSACVGLPSIANYEIYTVDVDTQTITRMTFDDDNVSLDYSPVWINGGNVILFFSGGSPPGLTQKDRLFAVDLLNDKKLIHLYDFPFDIVYFAEVFP